MCDDTTDTYNHPCMCGLDGNGYCPLFEGDIYLQRAILNFEHIRSIQCNYDIQLTSACYDSSLTDLLYFYYFYTNYTMYTDYYMLQGGKTCVSNTFNSDYWNAIKEIDIILNSEKHHHSFGVSLKIIALLIIPIIY